MLKKFFERFSSKHIAEVLFVEICDYEEKLIESYEGYVIGFGLMRLNRLANKVEECMNGNKNISLIKAQKEFDTIKGIYPVD